MSDSTTALQEEQNVGIDKSNGVDIWNFIRSDYENRLKNRPELLDDISNMDDKEMSEYRNFVKQEYKKRYNVDLGNGKTRPLEDESTERVWTAYKEGLKPESERNPKYLKYSKNLDTLDSGTRNRLISLAKSENSELLPYLKYNKRYLNTYQTALEQLYKEAQTVQKEPSMWNTWVGEFAKKAVGNAIINPANNIANLYRQFRGGVPYDNPERLSDEEIDNRAIDDAQGQMFQYLTRTKDLPEIQGKISIGRNIAGTLGDFASYISPGSVPGMLFKGGIKMATKAGVKNTLAGNAVKMAAGSVAALPVGTEVSAPVDTDIAGIDYVKDVAKEIIPSALGGAAMSVGLHGVGKVAQQLKGKYNPLYKTVLNGKAEDFSKILNASYKRVENGAGSEFDVNAVKMATLLAKERGLNPQDLFDGKIGLEYYAQIRRDWLKYLSPIDKFIPEGREFVEVKKTPNAIKPEPKGEKVDFNEYRAKTDERLKKAYQPKDGEIAGLLPEKAELAIIRDEKKSPTKRDLAKARAKNNRLPSGRIPIYLSGPVQKDQLSLFENDDLPNSNDVFERKIIPVQEMPLDMLKLSKDVPNFKENADSETGVVEGQQLEGRYERRGTAPIVVWERNNGDFEVITGRHRFDLAKRSGEQTIPAQIVREKDGFSVDDAKTFDAESNIRDGNGTVRDYANFFKLKPEMSEPEAMDRGLIAREKGRKGWEIGRNSCDQLYDLYRNGKISEDKATAIAANAPKNADVQQAVLRKQKSMNASELALFARNLDLRYRYDGNVATGNASAKQLDLFSNDSPWIIEAEKIAKTQAKMIKENLDKINAVRGAAKRPEAAKSMGVDVNNPDSLRNEIERLQIENKKIANPDGALLQKIREKAGLDPIEDNVDLDETDALYDSQDTFSDYSGQDIRQPKFAGELAEVYEKYKNKPNFLKAPNGNPTNLSLKEWLEARTDSYKKKYGDWETYTAYKFLDGEPIASVSTVIVPRGGFAAIREWAADIFKKQGGIAKNPILGDVLLDVAAVRDSLAHGGANLYKGAAFKVVKDVIESGYLIFNNVNKGRDSYYFAAPISIDGTTNIVVALIHKFQDSNRFYLHAVGTKESLQMNRVSGPAEGKPSASSTTSPEDFMTVLRNIFSVKKKDIKILLDENGEPIFSKNTAQKGLYDRNSRFELPSGQPFDNPAQSDYGHIIMELPEIVELAKDLLGGKYPQLNRKFGDNLNGRFSWRGAWQGSNENIELNPKIADLLTAAEYSEIHTKLLNRFRDALNLADDIDIETYIYKSPNLQKQFKIEEKKLIDDYISKIAPTRESYAARKTLAHEIGHLVDYLDVHKMPKGNILAHLAALNDYLKGTIKLYNGDTASNSVIRKELIDLSLWWRRGGRPFEDLSSKDRSYVSQPAELYADAFSVLVNAPTELQKRAPEYYKAFVDFMNKRPKAMQVYKDLQMLVKSGGDAVEAHRMMLVRDMLNKPEAVNRIEKMDYTKGEAIAMMWDAFTTRFIDQYQPIYRRIKAKKDVLPDNYYDYIMDKLKTYNYKATQHEAYLNKFTNDVAKALKAQGANWEDFTHYLFLKHVAENRKNIFNPLGYSAKTATSALAHLEKTLGPKLFAALEEAQNNWWKIRQEFVIEPLERARVFSPDLMEIIKNRRFYTPFLKQKTLEHAGDRTILEILERDSGYKGAGAKIFKQIGFIGEIQCPARSLLARDLSLIDFAYRNEAQKAAIDAMQQTDGKMISLAKKVNNSIDVVRSPSVGTLTVMENGRAIGYYVPRVISDMFNVDSNIALDMTTKYIYKTSDLIKGVFTAYNPGFWPVSFVRDIQSLHWKVPTENVADIRNVPFVGFIRDFIGVLMKLPDAKRSVFGTIDIDNVLKNGLVISKFESLIGAGTKSTSIMQQINAYVADPKANHSAKAELLMLQKFIKAWPEFGQVFDRAVKLYGVELVLKNTKLSPEAQRNIIRVLAGAPDFAAKGTLSKPVDVVALFYNAAIQSLKSIDDAVSRDKMSLWRYFWIAAPLAALDFAFAGLLGVGIQKVLAKLWGLQLEEFNRIQASIPIYDKVNYSCIPLGWADKEQCKAVYFRIPLTEELRYSKGLLSMMCLSDFQGGLSYAGDQLPGANPILTEFRKYWEYIVEGRNPQDSFRNKDVISPANFDEGGMAAWQDMFKNSWNNLGGTMITTFNDEPLGAAPKTRLEKTLSLPLASSILGRFLKISNKGLSDVARLSVDEVRAERAARKNSRDEFAKIYLDGSTLSKSELKSAISTPSEAAAFRKQIKDATISRKDPFYAPIILSSKSREESKIRAKALFDKGILPKEKYDEYMRVLGR